MLDQTQTSYTKPAEKICNLLQQQLKFLRNSFVCWLQREWLLHLIYGMYLYILVIRGSYTENI